MNRPVSTQRDSADNPDIAAMGGPQRSGIRRWFSRSAGIEGISRADVVLGLGLVLLAVSYQATANPGAPPVGRLLILLIPLALIWRRKAPLVAAAFATAVIAVNVVAAGSLVRCGLALPTVFVLAYSNGLRATLRLALVGLGLLFANVAIQAFNDPNLEPSVLPAFVPLTTGFWAAGRVVRSRQAMTTTLRKRTHELRTQREATASLAVATDRERMRTALVGDLQQRIGDLATTAERGRAASVSEPEDARRALSEIEDSGRQALTQMREVVGTLRDTAPTAPQPDLSQLRALLETSAAGARLHTEGEARALPAGIELSAYRIVEHILVALEDTPDAQVDVTVRFGADALELRIAGRSAESSPNSAIDAARARVEIHGGMLDTTTRSGRLEAHVRLPLVTAHG